MVIPPAEGGLEDAMKLTEMEAARHNQAPPDRRLDLGERDADLKRIGLSQAHAGEYAGAGDN